MGFFDSLKKGWGFMKAAFRMAGQNRKLLAPSVYMVMATLLYYIAWIVVLVAIDPSDWSDGQAALVGAIITLGSFLIFYFFCGMTVNMIDVHLKGGTPSLADGAKDAGKNFIAILFLAIISTIVEMIAKAVRGKDGNVAARIIAGIIEGLWTMAAFLLLPAIIIEDASFGQAMRRCRDLHKRNLLLIGVGEVGVRAVTALIGLAAILLIFGVLYLTFSILTGVAAIVVALIVGGTLFALYAAFTIYLRMAYYTCLYLWAVEVERVGQTAKAPGPLGEALGHLQPAPAAAA